jgi:dTDP-L-rhamnose 4-epimerase
VIAIFCTRLLNNLAPVLYEDGEQTRDFSFVEDIARRQLARCGDRQAGWITGERWQRHRNSDSPNRGATFLCSQDRHRAGSKRRISSWRDASISPATQPAFTPSATDLMSILADGIARYIDWIRSQSDIRDYFSEAAEILRNKGIVHKAQKTGR